MILFILLPCYNAERTLQRAIDSVINQLSSEIRLLIIDDGSTDNSSKIIRKACKNSPFVESISQTNQGLSRALGKGINYLQKKKITSECYIARLDSDDEYTSTGAHDILNFLKKQEKKYFCYIAGLLNEKGDQLTKIYQPNRFFDYYTFQSKNTAKFVDSVCSILNLKAFNHPKYSYNRVPARTGDGIPAMRIQKDFGCYLTDIYFYKVYAIPHSLSRRLISPLYAKIAFETNLILLNEFLLPLLPIKKAEIGDRYLIIARYAAVLKKYKEGLSYLILGIKYNPKNILYIGTAITCFLPHGYKIVNFFIDHFLFKK